jgi:hypothetical protein
VLGRDGLQRVVEHLRGRLVLAAPFQQLAFLEQRDEVPRLELEHASQGLLFFVAQVEPAQRGREVHPQRGILGSPAWPARTVRAARPTSPDCRRSTARALSTSGVCRRECSPHAPAAAALLHAVQRPGPFRLLDQSL